MGFLICLQAWLEALPIRKGWISGLMGIQSCIMDYTGWLICLIQEDYNTIINYFSCERSDGINLLFITLLVFTGCWYLMNISSLYFPPMLPPTENVHIGMNIVNTASLNFCPLMKKCEWGTRPKAVLARENVPWKGFLWATLPVPAHFKHHQR